MRITNLLIIPGVVSLLAMTACSNDEEYLLSEAGFSEAGYVSTRATSLAYPLSSFINTIDLVSADISKINSDLELMQGALGAGYNPLFEMLEAQPISKIYRGSISGNAPAAYNPTTNVIILKTGATLTSNMMAEELVHAGQNRVYPNGIAQYAAKAGTPNIEFEAKLTQDLISYVNGYPFSLGAGPSNITEYTLWVMNLCGDSDDPVFPSMNTVLSVKEDGDGYYQMVEAFKTKATQYNYPVLTSLKPLYINFTNLNYGS